MRARVCVCVCEREREREREDPKKRVQYTHSHIVWDISRSCFIIAALNWPPPPLPLRLPILSLPNILYMMCLSSHANHHSVATSTHRSSHANHHSVATSTHVSRLSNRLFKRASLWTLMITALKANFLASKITALSEASSD